MNTGMTHIDWTIIACYLLGVVGLGVFAGFRRGKSSEGGHYFLADNSLRWPVIGLAMFAANISTVHLVSLAQSAYTSGLLYGNYEWMAGFTLILLSLFFAPLYLRTRVSTLPDYLERRYNRNCRDALSFVSLISAIVIHIGVALFTAAAVLCFIFGIPEGKNVITFGTPTLSAGDFTDLPALVTALKSPQDSVAKHVSERLSGATRTALDGSQDRKSDSAAIKTALAADLNEIIRGGTLYQPERFSGVSLQPETQQLISRNPQGKELQRLNRALLEDAFPKMIAQPFGLSAMMLFIIVLGLLTGIYTVVGGLLAVVWTESVQTVLLLVGAICITVIGYRAVGGWDAMSNLLATHPHPLAGSEEVAKAQVKLSSGSFLHMMHAGGDKSVVANVPWYSILLGYPVIGIWYWCCDQTIVQRVLAARDEKHARLGPLFCAFLKILPVFFFVLPGVICVALVQKGHFGMATLDGVTRAIGPVESKDTYAFMITHLLPVGMKGLVVAAMLAAAMQTCSAALNSSATLFSYDIWKRWRPATSDHSLVKIGRWTTLAATLLAIVLSPVFGHYDTIFKGLNVLICYIAPPITAVFLVGVFWKRAGGRAAFVTMVAGGLAGALCFFLDFFKANVVGKDASPEAIAASPLWNFVYNIALKDFMLASFGLFCLCVLIQVVASLALGEPLKAEARDLVWENWTAPLRVKCGRGLSDYRVMSAVVLVIFIVLYAVFH